MRYFGKYAPKPTNCEKWAAQQLGICRVKKTNRTRLEAFSDGVIAIVITIMVLEMNVPHGVDWIVLKPL
jgi:hypothetical protein